MPDPKSPRLDDDVLKQAFRLAHATPAGSHLSEAQWEQLACGELDTSEQDAALTHIFSCDQCREIHRGLLQVGAEAPAFDTAAVAVDAARPIGRSWMYLGGLAAAAALVAAVLVDFRPLRTTSNGDVTRAESAATAIGIVAPTTGGRLADRRFAWQPIANADAFEVVVSTADGGAVWTGRVATTYADLPAEVVLAAGQYYWRVSALRDNAVIGSSPLTSFRVD